MKHSIGERRVALATSGEYPSLTPDDRLLVAPLARLGVETCPAVWDDPDQDWTRFDAVVIRSCWDYHLRPGVFLQWIERLERIGVAVWNPSEVIRWNHHKGYLDDLSGQGVEVVPTVRVPRGGGSGRWIQELEHSGWREVVVKPLISASAHQTWRLLRPTSKVAIRQLREAARRQPLMVQPFLSEIVQRGEWSFVFLAGEYSHAVLKKPAPGDFRVQHEHGGLVRRRNPAAELVAQARSVFEALSWPVLYARVDAVELEERLVLIELELIEPHLFLAADSGAEVRFARGLRALL